MHLTFGIDYKEMILNEIKGLNTQLFTRASQCLILASGFRVERDDGHFWIQG